MEQINSLIAIYCFLIGASVGSFLNVCIYRIPKQISIINPGSACPHCKKKIPLYLNIPIFSYIFLKGRCRFCEIPISIRYPGIEFLTAIIFLLLFYKFSLTPPLFFWSVFISVLIIISFIDIDHQIIPDILSLPGILIFSTAAFVLPEMSVIKVVLGILAGGGTLFLVAWTYYRIKKHEGMGGGDIKLLAMIGAATGVKGVFFTIFTGSLAGSIIGALMIFSSQAKDKQMRIPFGPFLSMGATLYIFWGNELINWYFNLLR